MFNLGIQDTMTVIIKDWKCEWNWNASQEKQNSNKAVINFIEGLRNNCLPETRTHLHKVQIELCIELCNRRKTLFPKMLLKTWFPPIAIAFV